MSTSNQLQALAGLSDLTDDAKDYDIGYCVAILQWQYENKLLVALIENLNLLEEQYIKQEHPLYKLITKAIGDDVQRYCMEILDARYGKSQNDHVRIRNSKRST